MSSEKLVNAAFSSEPVIRDRARNEIIDATNCETMFECAERALSNGDLEDAEFWYVEIATSSAPVETVARGSLELVTKVLATQNRLYESKLYVDYLISVPNFVSNPELLELESDINAKLSKSELKHGDGWKSIDLSQAMARGETQQYYHDRYIAYFVSQTETDEIKDLFAAFKTSFLPSVIGFIIGVSESTVEYGIDRETIVSAVLDCLKITQPNLKPATPKSGSIGYGMNHTEVSSQDEESSARKPESETAPQPAPKLGYGMKKH